MTGESFRTQQHLGKKLLLLGHPQKASSDVAPNSVKSANQSSRATRESAARKRNTRWEACSWQGVSRLVSLELIGMKLFKDQNRLHFAGFNQIDASLTLICYKKSYLLDLEFRFWWSELFLETLH